jgi:hypothetical protein
VHPSLRVPRAASERQQRPVWLVDMAYGLGPYVQCRLASGGSNFGIGRILRLSPNILRVEYDNYDDNSNVVITIPTLPDHVALLEHEAPSQQ